MKILGIDTSTDVLGLAIAEDDKLISEARYVYKRAHAEQFISAVDDLLKLSKINLSDIDVLAVSTGPGSFTGLRIGLAAVKGIFYERPVKAVAVSTLEVLALNGYFWNGRIVPMLKAQADEAYFAVYKLKNRRLNILHEPDLMLMRDLESFVDQDMLLIINGFNDLSDYLNDNAQRKINIAPTEQSMISGFAVALLGAHKARQGEFVKLESLEPFYLKEFKAKKKIGI